MTDEQALFVGDVLATGFWAARISEITEDDTVLIIGAGPTGNCTPIGASANIAGIGILRKEGYEVKTKDFIRIGIPSTLTAVIPAYIYLWVLFR